jgi:DNA replication factor GINS
MYNQLYAVWKKELESPELQKLPTDFYSEISSYFKKLREESRMLDKRTVKAELLETEMKNVKLMVHGLIRIRYKKLIKKTSEGQKLPLESLTTHEEKIFTEFLSLTEVYRNFVKALLQGHGSEFKAESKHKMVVLRFFREIPEIMGVDMKTYGPFKAEDIASIPVENAKILIKRGLAEKVEFT